MLKRAAFCCLLLAAPAYAQTSAPAPYSAPFQLRSAVAGNVIKSDTALAFSDGGTAIGSYLMGGIKILPDTALIFRVGLAALSPVAGNASPAVMNPQLGVLWSPKVAEDFRISPFVSVTIPVGMGGGDTPDAAVNASLASVRQARFSLDSAISLPNHLWVTAGLSAAWIRYGLTLQLEATVVQGVQVRGPDAVDDAVTNSISGAFVGYSIIPALNVGAELRYQRFLSTPASVEKNAELRDQLSFAVGARAHLHLDPLTIRPGVSFGHAIGGVVSEVNTNAVLFDLAVAF